MDPTARHHWDHIYATKRPDQVSWTQPAPGLSLAFIRSFGLPPASARIVDVGGGDSQLADHLLDLGYEHLTVLDISEEALRKAQTRLGPERAARVRWVVADVLDYHPNQPFDVWHDRAAFHFMTTELQVAAYMAVARAGVAPTGYLTIGTFSVDGPNRCSNLPVRQYDEETLTSQLRQGFQKVRCEREDHRTPFGTTQNFVFCSFRRA